MRTRWCDGRDMSKPEVLAELFEQAGLDVDAAVTRAQSDEINERLDKNTQDAIERGVFGVPTMFVGDEMFWGNDRFELVRFCIERARRAEPTR